MKILGLIYANPRYPTSPYIPNNWGNLSTLSPYDSNLQLSATGFISPESFTIHQKKIKDFVNHTSTSIIFYFFHIYEEFLRLGVKSTHPITSIVSPEYVKDLGESMANNLLDTIKTNMSLFRIRSDETNVPNQTANSFFNFDEFINYFQYQDAKGKTQYDSIFFNAFLSTLKANRTLIENAWISPSEELLGTLSYGRLRLKPGTESTNMFGLTADELVIILEKNDETKIFIRDRILDSQIFDWEDLDYIQNGETKYRMQERDRSFPYRPRKWEKSK